jgi:ParB family chromosome partitioning protein
MEAISKRRALGRGLGALIPGAFQPTDSSGQSLVPLRAIHPNPLQPRECFPETGIEELADSIRQKGILQPLLVRRKDDGFELIAGERRFRAAQRLGLEEVPVTIREADDAEMLEIALIENIQREDLNPLEEARAYRRLLAEFNLTQGDIAEQVGKDRSTIANTIRLLQLPAAVQTQIETGDLSAGHARALISIESDSEKINVARAVVARHLTVRETERLAKSTSAAPVNVDQKAAEQRLTETLGTKVRLVTRRNGSGRIEIEYYSLAELNGLLDRLAASGTGTGF